MRRYWQAGRHDSQSSEKVAGFSETSTTAVANAGPSCRNLPLCICQLDQHQIAIGTAEHGSQISILAKISSACRQTVDAMLQYAIGLSEPRLVPGTISLDGSRSATQLAGDFQQLSEMP